MTLDPNVLIALSLLCARQEPPSKPITFGFANPGGLWKYHAAYDFLSRWYDWDKEGCEREGRIAIDAHWCSVCGLGQFLTSGGLTCDGGHGGAPSLHYHGAPLKKHQWVDNPKDPAGYVCSACGSGDLDERAKYPCQ